MSPPDMSQHVGGCVASPLSLVLVEVLGPFVVLCPQAMRKMVSRRGVQHRSPSLRESLLREYMPGVCALGGLVDDTAVLGLCCLCVAEHAPYELVPSGRVVGWPALPSAGRDECDLFGCSRVAAGRGRSVTGGLNRRLVVAVLLVHDSHQRRKRWMAMLTEVADPLVDAVPWLGTDPAG